MDLKTLRRGDLKDSENVWSGIVNYLADDLTTSFEILLRILKKKSQYDSEGESLAQKHGQI